MHASACDVFARAVTSLANHMVAACTYCVRSKVPSLSWIYLYSSYFAPVQFLLQKVPWLTIVMLLTEWDGDPILEDRGQIHWSLYERQTQRSGHQNLGQRRNHPSRPLERRSVPRTEPIHQTVQFVIERFSKIITQPRN